MKHDGPKFECDKCLKKFHWRKYYLRHSKVCAPVQRHKCSHCGKHLSSAAILAGHVLIHHEPVACDICGITLSSLFRAQRHQVCEPNFECFQLTPCNNVFVVQLQNMMHEATKHTCQHCAMQVVGRISFQRHVSQCESKTVPCEFCGRTFKHLSAVREHSEIYCRANKASQKARYDRMTENSGITQEKIIDKHDVTDSCTVMEKISAPLDESGLSKTKCYYCNVDFSGPGHLHDHLKSYHDLSKCDTCGITVLGGSKKNNHKVCYTFLSYTVILLQ